MDLFLQTLLNGLLQSGLYALVASGLAPRTVGGTLTGRLLLDGVDAAPLAMYQLAARVGIDLSRSYAYSDSITDLPMLEAVGEPVAVNPDKDLRKIAEERDWQIRDFRRPVRLRSRLASAVPTPKPSLLAAVGGVAVAAVLVWVVFRSRTVGRRHSA